MPDLDAFEAEVREKIKQLASKDAETRRKAAVCLAEAGDPSAITGLAHTYKHDTDKRVREAAAYSLGMFRALEAGLAGKDQQRVMQLLEKVADGKMGGRVPIPTRTLVKVEVGLIVLAALLFTAGAALPSILNAPPPTTAADESPTQVANVPDKDRATLLQEIRQTLIHVSNDAQTLQTQFQSVMQGGQLDCAGFYNNPQPYQLSPNNASEFADIATLVSDLNQAVSNLASAKARFDQHCDGVTPLMAAEIGAPMGNIVSVIQAVPSIQEALAEAEAVSQATEAPTQTPEPANTEAPTLAPTPTIDVRPYRSDMLEILDEMTLPDGANTLLAQYWSEASAGSSAACRDVPPTIPNDYTLPPEVSQASLNLTRAMLQLNTGLAVVRDGWRAFANACASGTVGSMAAAGLQQTALANEAFSQARAALEGMR
jgi:hypothetical protein